MFDLVAGGYDDDGEGPWAPDAAEQQAALDALDDLLADQTRREIDDLSADATLDRVAAAARAGDAADRHTLRLAAHWAVLHPVQRRGAGTRGGERLVGIGGDGTPGVAEFACAELAVVLGVSVTAAWMLMADAVDLIHRLPRLWKQVQVGEVHPWVARKIAARTRKLDQAAAAAVDADIADVAGRLPFGRLLAVLDAAIITADPDRAAAEAAKAADKRGVWLGTHVEHGLATVFGRTDAPDAAALDQALDALAKAMSVLGDTDDYDIRRAKAIGVLADPEAAADLIGRASEVLDSQREPDPSPQPDHPETADADSTQPDPVQQPEPVGCDPRRGCDLGPATLIVHISADGLLSGLTGHPDRVIGRPELDRMRLGPLTMDTICRWLRHRRVSIRPVVDLNNYPAIDRYEIPARLRDAVSWRSPASCFPWSPNTSPHQELDHTQPYVPPQASGPTGQTRLDNLGLLDKRLHRLKTHAGWQVSQPRNGVWIWRSPHGHCYLVDHTGTTPLGKLDAGQLDAGQLDAGQLDAGQLHTPDT